MPRLRWPHLLLALLLPIAFIHQARSSVDAVSSLMRSGGEARRPFGVAYARTGSPAAVNLQPEATASGMREGDRLAAVEGEPLRGAAVLARALHRAHPGDTLRVTRADDGRELSITVQAARSVPPTWMQTAVGLVMQVGTPWFCLLLAAWVVVLRPRDPLAWLVCALLMSFGRLPGGGVEHWPSPIRAFATFYEASLGATWSLWMMLFGLSFPERLPWEASRPRMRWVLIAPLALFATALAAVDVLRLESFEAAAPLARLLGPVIIPGRLLQMVAIGLFFASMARKTATPRTPDARRRLVLLYLGASIGLTPAFFAAMFGMVRGMPPMSAVPAWLVVPILLMMMLFPLTLAYVIVVHRALDVRVVIRQGVQYALARGGVLVLRIAISMGIILAMGLLSARPDMRRVDIVTVVAAGIFLLVIMGKVAERLSRWTDRRFFRDALDAEAILHDLGEKVRTMVESRPLLETVARTLSDSMHVERVAFLMMSEGEGAYRVSHSLGFSSVPEAELAPGSATVARLRGGAAVRVYLDDPASWAGAGRLDARERAALQALDTHLLLPLSVNRTLHGLLILGSRKAESPYSSRDLALLQSLATQTALALENSRLTAAVADEVARRERLHREVEIAREVQERLFPQRLPAVPGFDYAGACRPALGVGGDYYDFLSLPGGRLGLAIADVSGKGIGAALLMASLQACLRGQTLQSDGAIARLMENVNQLLHEASPDNRYATVFYGQYDPATRRLTFVNAGHCAPLVLRRGAGGVEILKLQGGGTVIGLFPDTIYTASSVPLQPGDLLVAYTDGISEAMNAEEEEWGEPRLLACLDACDGLPAEAIIKAVMRHADAFVAHAPQHDDMTLVVARVL